jgi:hypothetical protein
LTSETGLHRAAEQFIAVPPAPTFMLGHSRQRENPEFLFFFAEPRSDGRL